MDRERAAAGQRHLHQRDGLRLAGGGLLPASGPVDLRYADFGSLDVSAYLWPKEPAQFQIQGASYKTILPEEPKSHEKLLDLINKAAYSADVYSRLKSFFYAKATGPMQIALSSRGSGASGGNIFTDSTGLAVCCSTRLLAMGVIGGRLAFPVPF